MEPTFQLTPESARALALRLFSKDEFNSDPKNCIIRALDWLDKASMTDDAESAAVVSTQPVRNALIGRLSTFAEVKGISHEIIAKEVGVSLNTLRSWLHGAYEPSGPNRHKIEKFLQEREASPTNVGAESAVTGELFMPAPTELGQQQAAHETASQP
jgi:hypothetical protein